VPDRSSHLLALNCGSSSIRYALYDAAAPHDEALRGKFEDGPTLDACRDVLAIVETTVGLGGIAAIGHRVVDGGSRFRTTQRVRPEVMDELHRTSPLAPAHLPAQIAVIERCADLLPAVPQFVCFDSAFHQHMPPEARYYPLPRQLRARGIERRGFHGLSYAYLMHALAAEGGAVAARGRVILAHLGHGASLAAVRDGTGIDTTMGLTPAGGIPMSNRSGDLDPGLVEYLTQTIGLSAQQFDTMVNTESGLLGISETSDDLRVLLDHESSDPRAAEAVTHFCYQVRKAIGAYAAALGGLDTLVFAGGIGEHAPTVRERICAELAFLGVQLDPAQNAADAPIISVVGAPVTVRVIPTDEERMIALDVARVLAAAG
jgi:acetate kinase